MGRGVHTGWSEAGDFRVFVFLVQEQCSQSTGQALVCDACVGGRSLARAWAWAGAATRVSYAFTSLGWRALLYFRLQALRTCDASQVSPRASERSPSRPTGLETNVSASVPAPKKTRVLKHNPHEEDCRHYHHSCGEAWRALRRRAYMRVCQVTQILPLGEQLCISVHWAVLQWPGSRERRVWTRFDDTVEAAHSDLKLASPRQAHPPDPCRRS